MITFIKIAWRNIIRNKKRSLITMCALSFGLGALIFIWSFVEGAHRQMIENYTSLMSSHIQIHKKGFHQNSNLELSIDNSKSLMVTIRKFEDVLKIKGAAPRIKAVGLVSSAEASVGVMVMGVSPDAEKRTSTLYKRIREGTFLDEKDEKGIVLGKSTASNLNVTLGDKVVIMSQAYDGSIAAETFHILGLFETGTEEIDKGIALINLATAQRLFVMENKISEVAIQLQSVEDIPATIMYINNIIPQTSLEVLTWEQISPSFKQWIEFDNGFIWLIVIVIMIVVAIGILNTVLMGVLERTREFGILLSLGTKPKEIVLMVGWESFFLGLLGSLMGVVMGTLITFYFKHVGIDLSIFSGALNAFYIDAFIYPQLNTDHLFTSVELVLSISIVVSIYPAFHASKLKPVEAIRSV